MRLARGKATSGQLRHPLIWALGALAVGFAPHTPYFPAWITALTAVCMAFRLLAEHYRWHLPSTWIRSLFAVFAFIGVLAMYSSINGVVPGTALLAVMAALKLLETHRQRDLYVLLFIALFLVLSALLREQALWSLPYLCIALVITVIAWQQVARRGAALPLRASLQTGLRVSAQAAPLLLVFWVLFPRVPGPFWAVPTQAGSASTGISDRIEPGSIASLIQSNEVAFRVEFMDEMPPARDLYWRGPVMERLVGRAWTITDPLPYGRRDGKARYEGAAYRYRMTLQPTGQRWVFGLDVPETWDLPSVRLTSTQQLAVFKPLDERTVINLRSYTRFTIGESLHERTAHYLTRLPPESNPRTRELARELRAASADVDEFVSATLQLFRNDDFVYTLEPPGLGLNSVDEFLFRTKAGFCEHYAAAFATLMRAGGVPARLVAGYHGGEVNPLGGYLIVRQSDAHAWVEIWREGAGWTRVDPTAEVSAVRIESGLDAALGERRGIGRFFDVEWLRNAGLTWDMINARWDEWVLGYGPETQQRFMRWLGIDDPRWETLATLLGVGSLLVLALVALALARRYRPPATDAAEAVYRRTLAAMQLVMAPHETPSMAAARARTLKPDLANDVERVFDAYQQLRFADRGNIETLRRDAKALIRQWRAARATGQTPH